MTQHIVDIRKHFSEARSDTSSYKLMNIVKPSSELIKDTLINLRDEVWTILKRDESPKVCAFIIP